MLGGKGLEYGLRRGVRQRRDAMGAQHAGEIEADGDHMVGGDFHADRRAAIRIDSELDRRLTPASAAAAEFLQQFFTHQLIDDVGDCLGCQMGDLGDLGATERSVTPDEVEDDSPVMLAAPLRIFPIATG